VKNVSRILEIEEEEEEEELRELQIRHLGSCSFCKENRSSPIPTQARSPDLSERQTLTAVFLRSPLSSRQDLPELLSRSFSGSLSEAER
jgi:hypothetical protein